MVQTLGLQRLALQAAEEGKMDPLVGRQDRCFRMPAIPTNSSQRDKRACRIHVRVGTAVGTKKTRGLSKLPPASLLLEMEP